MATATATILFTDVENSTTVRTQVGETAADRLFVDLERRLSASVERRAGRVLKTAGDGVMAAFESACDAVHAAVDMQRAVARREDGLRLRIGIAAGDVSWEGNDCFGLPVVTAARLQAHAQPGQVLVSQIVRLLAGERADATFTSVGAVDLKGLPDPIEAYTVSWEPAGDPDSAEVPIPAMLTTSAAFPFVSRESEWQTLQEAWTAVRDGSRRVVLVGGEAGGGKTRLVAEFAQACHDDGGAVLFGGCDPELVIPYQPWVQALEHLFRTLSPEALDPHIADGLGVLAPLLSSLERRTVGPSPFAVDADSERYRLFAAIDDLFAEASRRWPVVVVLDDLHWGSTQTWALLAHLARGNAPSRTLVIGTFRDVGADATDPLLSSLADLRRVDTVTRIRLHGFDAGDVADLVARTAGHDLDEPLQDLVSEVTARTLGNAFFVGEMWHHLVASGVVERRADRWVVAGSLEASGVPDSIREVVAERLARLPFSVRRLAELVAVTGQRVELRVVNTAADIPPAEVTAGLDALTTAGLLEAIERPLLAYQFSHALVRDTVEAGVPAATRAHLHLRVAEALESVYEGDPRPVLAELARHYTEAAGLGAAPKAVYYGRRAAEQAIASVAYEEALKLLTRALELTTSDSVSRAELLVGMADAENRLGGFEAAAKHAQEAFHLAREHGAARVAAEAAIAFADSIHIPGLPGQPAVTMVAEAIGLVGDDGSAIRAELEASLALAYAHAGDVEAAHAVRDSALRLAGAHDARIQSRAFQAAMISEQDPERLVELAGQAQVLAESSGDLWSLAYATTNYMRAYIALGQLDEMAPILERHAALSARLFLSTGFIEHWSYRVVLGLARGDFVAAEEAADRCYEIASVAVHPSAQGMYGLQMFAIRREQGRLVEAAPILEQAAKQAVGGVWEPGLAALYTELDDLDRAAEVLDRLAPNDFAAVPRDSLWTATGPFLADACIAVGNRAHAEPLYRDLARFENQNLMVAMTVAFGPADRVLGGLAGLLGLDAAADRHFEIAVAVAERSGAPVWLARVQHDWARCLARRGDHIRAGELADRALTTAEHFGMARLAEQCREIPRRPMLVTLPSFPDGLSQREVDVLRAVAAGCSNREIGERLNISANTAANHVRAILQKTASSNRAEAAAYAARNGLL